MLIVSILERKMATQCVWDFLRCTFLKLQMMFFRLDRSRIYMKSSKVCVHTTSKSATTRGMSDGTSRATQSNNLASGNSGIPLGMPVNVPAAEMLPTGLHCMAFFNFISLSYPHFPINFNHSSL